MVGGVVVWNIVVVGDGVWDGLVSVGWRDCWGLIVVWGLDKVGGEMVLEWWRWG